ncbi:class I SAM-dependent methyltransferase [Pyxidicoccus fallax]|uniref:Class I SAM-dependent methyltransferase n=1 Tax=Pyxidicoccus fallax TaxID=394095 RepID=A0A848L9B1_9BACT|nr:class I SAM-dependent methyltransferase [Pyxidicoccus fallax]NMO15157.1 class I SAM-dependent methyltransferase [Pyxidicoccus fallax]NPC77779.1 class I SAM-dependent methyltransferase [Pyxidicoccus fallax]
MSSYSPVASTIVVAHPEDVVRLFSTVAPGASIAVVAAADEANDLTRRELHAVGMALGARSTRMLALSEVGPWLREQAALGAVRVHTHSPQEDAPRHRELCLAVGRAVNRLRVPALGARPTAVTVLDDRSFHQKLGLLNALYRERPDGAGEACTLPVRDGPGIEAFCDIRHADVVRALSLTKPEIFTELEDPWGFTHSTYERERYALTARLLGALAREGRAPRTVMDVGACEGLMTEQLLSLFPEAHVQAVESEPGFVSRLRARLGGEARVRIVDASALDVPLEADLVLLAEVLYYLPMPQGRELLGHLRAEHVLTSYGGPFAEEVHADLRALGWKTVAADSLPGRIEPMDGVSSPLLVRRAGTQVRLWAR